MWLLYSLYFDFIQDSRAGDLSRLVSSRLVERDKVDSGEYKVMGFLRRKFSFFPLRFYIFTHTGERGGSDDLEGPTCVG